MLDIQIRMNSSGYVNVFQWNREWFFSRRVKFDSGFNVMAEYEISRHGPEIICCFTGIQKWVVRWWKRPFWFSKKICVTYSSNWTIPDKGGCSQVLISPPNVWHLCNDETHGRACVCLFRYDLNQRECVGKMITCAQVWKQWKQVCRRLKTNDKHCARMNEARDWGLEANMGLTFPHSPRIVPPAQIRTFVRHSNWMLAVLVSHDNSVDTLCRNTRSHWRWMWVPIRLNHCRVFCGGANLVARQLSHWHLQSATIIALLGELLISNFNWLLCECSLCQVLWNDAAHIGVDIVELRPLNWLREREIRRIDLSRNRQCFLTTSSALLHCATPIQSTKYERVGGNSTNLFRTQRGVKHIGRQTQWQTSTCTFGGRTKCRICENLHVPGIPPRSRKKCKRRRRDRPGCNSWKRMLCRRGARSWKGVSRQAQRSLWNVFVTYSWTRKCFRPLHTWLSLYPMYRDANSLIVKQETHSPSNCGRYSGHSWSG